MTLLAKIRQHADAYPEATALAWPGAQLSYRELVAGIETLSDWLTHRAPRIVALDMDNGADWVMIDITALELNICVVPLPRFFSDTQIAHVIRTSGVEAIITDRPDELCHRLGDLLGSTPTPLPTSGQTAQWIATSEIARATATAVPEDICKITFTSGTTGEPKGVLLDWAGIRAVTQSLVDTVQLDSSDRHMTLTPLAVLLENIAGVYAPLWAGGCTFVPGLTEIGMRGASSVDGARMTTALNDTAATTAIFMPQTLAAVVGAIVRGADLPPLRFAAVGGAAVSTRLLQQAANLNLPVFEGYGLSECASVVCLNTPEQHKAGSVGQPLPHVDLAIDESGEVIIRNATFRGYLGENRKPSRVLRTGDIGELDAEGFLHLHGRRRNVFITAFGRNVSPEWVERELLFEEAIGQAVLFGDARPFNVAVIACHPAASNADVDSAIARVNSTLPDYARITRWINAAEPFSLSNNMLTGTGRPRRDRILSCYSNVIDSLYSREITQ